MLFVKGYNVQDVVFLFAAVYQLQCWLDERGAMVQTPDQISQKKKHEI